MASRPLDHYRDRVAIVTGGASGIGCALCLALAANGAQVVVFDKDGPGAEAVAHEVERLGASARPVVVDVTVSAALEMAIDRTIGDLGRLDFMFNNAGISVLGEIRDMRLEHWQRVLDVNLLAAAYGSQLAYQRMIPR